MKIEWELTFLSSDKAHLLECLKNKVFRRHGETRDQFSEQPRGEEYMEKFQDYDRDILTILNAVHQVRDFGRSQSHNALHHQQEQFKHAVQEHQRVTHDQVEIAAAVAPSRTPSQMTSRFRDTEK